MTSQTRTLVFLGFISIGAVVVLAMMADRYAKMHPMKSVHDLETTPPVREGARPAPVPAPTETTSAAEAAAQEGAAGDGSGEGPQASPDASAVGGLVDGFVEVREAVIEAIDADPGLKRRMLIELSGEARHAPSRIHYKILIDVKLARMNALEKVGMSEDEYRRVRESFIAWMGHEFAEKPAEPELVAEFDRRREQLEPLYLDLLETVDQ